MAGEKGAGVKKSSPGAGFLAWALYEIFHRT